MIIIFPIIAIILLILYKQKIIKNIYLNTFIKYLLIASIISPVLELTIFSFRHYESLFYKNPETLKYTIGSGLECKNNICSITDKENAYLEITSINTKIENLYLDITSKDNLNLKYDITYNDEANQNPFKVGTRNYLSRVKNSHYIRINTSGKSTYLKINLTKANHKFTINELSINQKVPFFISNTRLIITFLVTLFLFLINPKNKLQDLTYNFSHSKLITCILIIILSLFFGFLTLFNIKSYTTIPTSQYSQYKNLARSLSKGQVYLDLDVNPKLLELNNPYDTHYRDEHLQRYHDYYWDYAFYNGKYYSYFGIVPCLLTYNWS